MIRYEDMAMQREVITQRSPLILSADLGQRNDYTALCVVRQTPEALHRFPGDAEVLQYFDVLHLDRFRGVPYPEVSSRILTLMSTPELKGQTTLLVDASGVGLPVVQTMLELGLAPVAITITGGLSVSQDPLLEGGFRVPSRDLRMATEVVLQSGRLRIASLPLRAQLEEELKGFKIKVNNKGRESMGSETEELHDDLVMSLCMALWYASRGGSRSMRQLDEDYTDNLGSGGTVLPGWDLLG